MPVVFTSAEEAWKNFESMCVSEDASDAERVTLEKGFYAGVVATLGGIVPAVATLGATAVLSMRYEASEKLCDAVRRANELAAHKH